MRYVSDVEDRIEQVKKQLTELKRLKTTLEREVTEIENVIGIHGLALDKQQTRSELGEVANMLLMYSKGKGQLMAMDKLVRLIIMQRLVDEIFYGRLKVIDFDQLIALSIHAPVHREPLWSSVLKNIAQGLTTKVEMITQQVKKKPIISAGGE